MEEPVNMQYESTRLNVCMALSAAYTVTRCAWKQTAYHDDVTTWNAFRITGPLWGASTGQWRIPFSDADLGVSYIVCQKVILQTVELLVIWDDFRHPYPSGLIYWLWCNLPQSQWKSPGMGVTKAPFVNVSVSKIFDLAEVPVRFLESHSYLTGVTTAELRWYLLNINVIFNN